MPQILKNNFFIFIIVLLVIIMLFNFYNKTKVIDNFEQENPIDSLFDMDGNYKYKDFLNNILKNMNVSQIQNQINNQVNS
jgi:hypothetical protein